MNVDGALEAGCDNSPGGGAAGLQRVVTLYLSVQVNTDTSGSTQSTRSFVGRATADCVIRLHSEYTICILYIYIERERVRETVSEKGIATSSWRPK